MVVDDAESAPSGVVAGRRATRPAGDAAFLVQMMACRDGAPAYRRYRRAEPRLAHTSYQAALALLGQAALAPGGDAA